MRIAVVLFLSLVAYDLNLFRRRKDSYTPAGIEYVEREREQKKIRRIVTSPIPTWLRGGRVPVRSKCNYFSTKSRDVRDSNQRMIRRKFNNL